MLNAMVHFFDVYEDDCGIKRTYVMALIHDGCIVRRHEKYATLESIESALNELTEFVHQRIGYRVNFVVKSLEMEDEGIQTIVKLPFFVKKNPITTAMIFNERMRLLYRDPMIYKMEHNQSCIFDRKQNCWIRGGVQDISTVQD